MLHVLARFTIFVGRDRTFCELVWCDSSITLNVIFKTCLANVKTAYFQPLVLEYGSLDPDFKSEFKACRLCNDSRLLY